MSASATLTIAQAAFVVGEPLDAFKKAVEKAPVKPRIVRKGGRPVRQFAMADLVFLHAYRELKQELTPKSQAALYEALLGAPHGKRRNEVVFGNQKYDLGRHIAIVESKLKELEKLAAYIDSSGGEALISGTRIEAHRIAALLDGGMTVEAVLGDYPSLNERQVLAAKAYADANPKPGRPFPKQTAKAAMRASGLGELDDED